MTEFLKELTVILFTNWWLQKLGADCQYVNEINAKL
jgi:hypothetical protein